MNFIYSEIIAFEPTSFSSPSALPLLISVLALAVAILSLFFSTFHTGKIKMSRPNQIWFGYAGAQKRAHVMLKSVLYSTGKQGQIVERIYVTLIKANSSQEFNAWVIGKNTDTYKPGGLRITKNGYLGDHHFMLANDGSSYTFLPGTYELNIFAKISNKPTDQLLQKINLNIPEHFQVDSSKFNTSFNFHSSNTKYVAELDNLS